MNDQRFDHLTRRLVSLGRHKASRRSVLQALGFGAVTLNSRFGGLRNARAQQATPAPVPRAGQRAPGGRTIEQMAFDLEYDVDKMFRFVADEVQYDPYPGILRGAKGTLWGRAGNSVDKAILLAGLLQQGLVQTRFVIGELSDETATRLLDTARITQATAKERAVKINALLTPEQGAPIPDATPTAEQQQFLDGLSARAEQALAKAQRQLEDGVTLIEDALAGAGVTLPAPTFALPDRERVQHVWLQYAAGPKWIDLDPLFPGAEPGTIYATPSSTVADLPEDLFHTLTFRVVAEKIQTGQAVRGDLLTYQARGADLVGSPLTLVHLKPEALKGLGLGILDAVEGTIQYIPHLSLGSTDVVAATDRVTFVTGEGLIDAFGDRSRDGDTIAEWLEIEIQAPDAPPRRVSREIFDRVGIAQRAAGEVDLTTLPPAALTDLASDGQVFLPVETVWSLVTATGPVPLSYFQQDYAVADFFANLGYVAHASHTVRDGLALQIATSAGHRLFLDAPNLTAFTLTPIALSADESRGAVEVDLIHQHFGLAPFADAGGTAHPRVVAGVLSHVAERLLMEANAQDLPAPTTPLTSTSVGLIFEEAERQGIAIVTLSPATTPATDLAISDRAQARIAEALAAGYAVVVPTSAVTLNGQQISGWWQIDPSTGIAFDLLETGRGEAGLEYAATVQVEVQAAPAVQRVGVCTVAVIILAVSAALIVGFTGYGLGSAMAGGDPGLGFGLGLGGGMGGAAAGGAVGYVAC